MAGKRTQDDSPLFPTNRFRWTPKLARLLGAMPDSRVAEITGLNTATVLKERRRRGIAAFQPHRPTVEWTEDMIKLLGTASDYAVGAELDISYASVRRKRRELGIPPYHEPRQEYAPREWSSDELEMLGRRSDATVARKLGVSPTTVTRKRQDLGIPPYGRAPQPIEWTDEMIAALGTMRDSEVARRFGLLRQDAVLEKRQELGIPSKDSRHVWSDAETALLGTMPDRQVAKRVGVSVEAASSKRNNLGIEPHGGRKERHIWTDEEKQLLGTVPDAALARAMELTRELVKAARQRLDIPAFRQPEHPAASE